jgi:DNA-binding protein H-NS
MNSTLEMLDALSDEELHAVGARVNELLKAHDDDRKAKALADAKALKAKALADARAVLAEAGLSLKDMGAKKPRAGKAPAYHVGRQYRHPVHEQLTWNGKGQKPGWLRELEGEGGKALELSPPSANDNRPKATPTPVRKTGP